MQYWLQPPRGANGWRFDVANMTARHRAYQGHLEVWSELRAAVKAKFPDAYLLGEHSQDGPELLQGNCFDGVMNYQGFLAPLLCWLVGGYVPVETKYRAYPKFTRADFQAQVTQFLYAIPWQIALMMYNAINTHDRPRFISASNHDHTAYRSAIVFLFSFVGVPAVYYGDEIGLPGSYDPDNRRCMPWDTSQWDRDLQTLYRTCIRLRKESSALCTGSFQWLPTSGPAVCFARFDENEVLLSVLVEPSAGAPISVSLYPLGIRDGEACASLSQSRRTITEHAVELPPVADIYRLRSIR